MLISVPNRNTEQLCLTCRLCGVYHYSRPSFFYTVHNIPANYRSQKHQINKHLTHFISNKPNLRFKKIKTYLMSKPS